MISVIIPSLYPVTRQFPAPWVQVLNPHGGHFVENVRRGFRQSTGEYILYLNDDAEIGLEGIKKLAEYLDTHPDVAIVGPNIEPGLSYGREPSVFNALCDFFRLPKIFTSLARGQYGNLKLHDVGYISGACLMARRDYADFSWAYTAFYEDVDLCKRARVRGKRVVYLPSVRVHHVGGESYRGPQKDDLMHAGLVTYLNLWHGSLYADITVWLYEHRLFT